MHTKIDHHTELNEQFSIFDQESCRHIFGCIGKGQSPNNSFQLDTVSIQEPQKNIDDICDVFLEDAFLHENGQINVKQREKERKDSSFPCYDLLSRNGDGRSAFTRKISQCFDFDSQETQREDKKSEDTDQLSVAIEQEESEQLHPFQPEDFEAPELLFEMPDYSSLENKKHKRRKKEENTQPLQTEFDGYYVMQ